MQQPLAVAIISGLLVQIPLVLVALHKPIFFKHRRDGSAIPVVG